MIQSDRYRLQWFLVGVLVLWVAFIWGHSLIPGSLSTAESDAATKVLAPLLTALGVNGIGAMTFVVRKAAHFMEYTVLGLLSYIGIDPDISKVRDEGEKCRRLIRAATLCVFVACADEAIQLLVPGRDGRLADVALDLCGCVAGMLAATFVGRFGDRRRMVS